MKEYIRDNGKVRNCTSNVAKMNIFEWMYYNKSIIILNLYDALEQICEGVILLGAGIINLGIIILLPITYPIEAYINIRNARKVMKHYENRNDKG